MKSCAELRIDLAIGIWADIHQQVGIIAGGTDEPALDLFGALVVAVPDVESPALVERIRHFEGELRADVGRVESRRVLAGEIALEGLDIFAGTRRLMMIGHDQGRWLQ